MIIKVKVTGHAEIVNRLLGATPSGVRLVFFPLSVRANACKRDGVFGNFSLCNKLSSQSMPHRLCRLRHISMRYRNESLAIP
jgi:hypothetical protein